MRFSKLIFIIFILTISCKNNPKESIVKKWKIDIQALKNIMKEKPDDSDKGIGVLDEFTNQTLDFKADGTAETVIMGHTTKGKWSISDDGKKLTLESDGKTSEATIVELSKNTLILQVDKDTKMPFVPAN